MSHGTVFRVLLFVAGFSLMQAMRMKSQSNNQELTEFFSRLQAGESPMKAMDGIYTASKYEYDPRPGRDFESKTLIDMLEEAAKTHPDDLAFRAPHQDKEGNLVKKGLGYSFNFGAKTYKYTKYTWKQYRDLVMEAATAFVAMGMQPMDAVNIRGINSPEWLISFLGCIAAGGLPVGLYPTDSPETLEFKAQDSGAAFIVVAKVKDLELYSEFIDKLPSVKAVIMWDGKGIKEDVPTALLQKLSTAERPLLMWNEFMERGSGRDVSHHLATVEQRIRDIKPGQAASVVYTSGTTGQPKGVMLSHDSMTWVAEQTSAILTEKPSGGDHRIVSYLPLNHVAGQMMDIIWPLYATQSEDTHVTTFFPAMCYLKKRCIPEQLKDAEPTLFLGVPEVWDGLRLKIEEATSSGISKWLKEAAPSLVLGGVGLGKVMYAITGAGPITRDTLWFFHNMGINILNIFAQSESAALGTAWQKEYFDGTYNLTEKFGSIGKRLGNHLKTDPETGEIMLKGRNVMLGYMNRMDKTESTITKDGWLMTGDKGEIDKDHFVFLVGRLKEIMKSHGGEMIAPVTVEEGIKKACNADGLVVKQAVLQGDGYYYLSVLLTLVEEANDGIPTGNLAGAAKGVDPAAKTIKDSQSSKVWADRLSNCIADYNKVAAKSPEKVYRYAILPMDITAEASPDLMTPTFKIKRDGVSAEYKELIKTCGGAPEDGLPSRMSSVEACGK